MGDGTRENPYTSEDIRDIISRRGGDVFGLDFSGKHFKRSIDLRNLKLIGIILNDTVLLHAKFDGSNLKWAKLREANLQGASFSRYKDSVTTLVEADLSGALLQDASFIEADLEMAKFGDKKSPNLVTPLFNTDFRGADLHFAEFYECSFFRTKFYGVYLRYTNISESNLDGIDWGSHRIGEENDADFHSAERVYRQLKTWYTEHGIYDVAGEFFYREMEVKRKFAQEIIQEQFEKSKLWEFLKLLFKEKYFGSWIRLWVYRLTCGYGERPWRVVLSAATIIFGLALVYFLVGSSWQWSAFWNSLYFSAVSFTALGYGSWVNTTSDWIKGLGAAESFVGVFMMALFLITFVRKMTR